MIRPSSFSPSERSELEGCVRRQRGDHGIARRANALLLLDDDKSCQEIAEFLYLDNDTIRGWYPNESPRLCDQPGPGQEISVAPFRVCAAN